jgi:hypothetical protein
MPGSCNISANSIDPRCRGVDGIRGRAAAAAGVVSVRSVATGMTSDSESLERRVAEWLDGQGYPLEMTVGQAFRKAGFFVVQSDYYRDPETGKPREIDVDARIQRDSHGILTGVVYTIECKLARDKPWVLFTSADIQLAGPARVTQRAASRLGRQLLDSICQRPDIQALPALRAPLRPGYGLTQAFTDREDLPYTAVVGAAKAALVQASLMDRLTDSHGALCFVLFPAVVIHGKLFECYLNERLETTVSEIDSGTLLWRNPVVGMPHTIVHVVTLSALDTFATDALDTARGLLQTCHVELAELARRMPPDAPRWGVGSPGSP